MNNPVPRCEITIRSLIRNEQLQSAIKAPTEATSLEIIIGAIKHKMIRWNTDTMQKVAKYLSVQLPCNIFKMRDILIEKVAAEIWNRAKSAKLARR